MVAAAVRSQVPGAPQKKWVRSVQATGSDCRDPAGGGCSAWRMWLRAHTWVLTAAPRAPQVSFLSFRARDGIQEARAEPGICTLTPTVVLTQEA